MANMVSTNFQPASYVGYGMRAYSPERVAMADWMFRDTSQADAANRQALLGALVTLVTSQNAMQQHAADIAAMREESAAGRLFTSQENAAARSASQSERAADRQMTREEMQSQEHRFLESMGMTRAQIESLERTTLAGQKAQIEGIRESQKPQLAQIDVLKAQVAKNDALTQELATARALDTQVGNREKAAMGTAERAAKIESAKARTGYSSGVSFVNALLEKDPAINAFIKNDSTTWRSDRVATGDAVNRFKSDVLKKLGDPSLGDDERTGIATAYKEALDAIEQAHGKRKYESSWWNLSPYRGGDAADRIGDQIADAKRYLEPDMYGGYVDPQFLGRSEIASLENLSGVAEKNATMSDLAQRLYNSKVKRSGVQGDVLKSVMDELDRYQGQGFEQPVGPRIVNDPANPGYDPLVRMFQR